MCPLRRPSPAHVQCAAGVDTTLDVYEQALQDHPRDDHRLRLEHVGAIRPEQLQRAAALGVTCSIFVDQIHYWGDVIVDGLFGPERGSRWMPADRKSTRLNSSHTVISYAVFCLK